MRQNRLYYSKSWVNSGQCELVGDRRARGQGVSFIQRLLCGVLQVPPVALPQKSASSAIVSHSSQNRA